MGNLRFIRGAYAYAEQHKGAERCVEDYGKKIPPWDRIIPSKPIGGGVKNDKIIHFIIRDTISQRGKKNKF
jgi:hypothetical protein